MTQLKINYDNGSITINLEEFLSCRSITKVRKLQKIIKRSYTQDASDQIQQHIEERLKCIDGLAKVSANQVVRLTDEVKKAEYDYKIMRRQRDRNTRNSAPYKYYNEKVKLFKTQLKEKKSSLDVVKREFNNHVKDKAFFEKLMSEVFS